MRRRKRPTDTTDTTERVKGCPEVKLLTNGSGKVWTVDENGKPLGNTTDNSAIRTQQGFQAIKNGLNYWIQLEKYLMENALNTVSIIV